MTEYVFAPRERPSVPVAGTDRRFPVRRVYCVGRNYAEHAREMGGDPAREPPFFFSKPADALVAGGGEAPFPPATNDVHHEVELVVALGKGGADIAVDQALAHVYGYAVGIDLTRRDLQAAAKKAGRPWETAKGFDASAPIGAIAPASRVGHPAKAAIRLKVNGAVRQSSDISRMIWSVAETLSHLSGLFRLEAGDLVFTGTPEGVGPVRRGDALEAGVEGIGEVKLRIV
ncbi:MAG: fumarylacetoacetate hydrolase family protein [Proteobacteria bacterium]|nr:fumarylacetoacetate hydrolase family protein [Pseudomonadota bacterium]